LKRVRAIEVIKTTRREKGKREMRKFKILPQKTINTQSVKIRIIGKEQRSEQGSSYRKFINTKKVKEENRSKRNRKGL
jgi:hypothetical protein